jgi:outer membrane immunogenic protein
MKSLYYTCLGALLLSTSLTDMTSAADLPADYVPTQSYSPAKPGFDWDGFFAGIHGGYLWGDADAEHDVTSLGTFGKNYDPSGGFLGVHAAYLHQFEGSRLVVGIDGDWDYNWADGDMEMTQSPAFNPYPNAYGEADIKWTSSIRARLGYAFGRTLPYLTAGAAFARLGYSEGVDPSQTMYEQQDDRTMVGWTVGAGVAHAFSERWSAFVEYRYSDYGSETFLPTPVASQPTDSSSIDLTTHAVRFGVSYKLLP